MLPGDTSDVNHGDLTRGGLSQRGVNLGGVTAAAGMEGSGPREDQGRAWTGPGQPTPNVMQSHIEEDGGQRARMWGERDEGGPRVGSLRTGSWMSDTRFICGGQEPGQAQRQVSREGFQRWVSGEQAETQRAFGRTVNADEERLPGRRDTNAEPLRTGDVGEPGEGQSTPGSASISQVGPDDASILTDMLMTEKFVSGAYDAAIFESADPQVRQALQQIQRDEQRHGEWLAASFHGKIPSALRFSRTSASPVT